MRARTGPSTLVVGMGTAQLVAWGALYYAVAVLGAPMGRELGARDSLVFGAFAWSLLLSGVLAPSAGKLLDRRGGRFVLAASTLVGALGFSILAAAQSAAMLFVGWSFNGVAMALGLYDTCFAALAQATPHGYRRAVTGVTLIAGFASSVAWPSAHYLREAAGWRGSCLIFAGALLVCLPLYLSVLPRHGVRTAHSPSAHAPPVAHAPDRLLPKARALALTFAGASLISAALSAHLVATIATLGFEPEHAVWVASSVGALQVFGRLLELAVGARHSAVRLGFVTFAGLAGAMLCLVGSTTAPVLIYVFVGLYGVSNGLATIAKAALPVELFGLKNVGAVLGAFGAPSLVARAIAPLAYALAVGELDQHVALGALALVSVARLAGYTRIALGLRETSPGAIRYRPGTTK